MKDWIIIGLVVLVIGLYFGIGWLQAVGVGIIALPLLIVAAILVFILLVLIIALLFGSVALLKVKGRSKRRGR